MSAYEHGEEFDILHDHTGPVGVSIGAMSDCPTVHTLHGPFTDEAKMLYRRIARRHWFVAISESQRSMGPPSLRWAGVVYNGILTDRYVLRKDKEDFLLFLGRADEEKAPHLAIQAARRAGRRLVLCVTTKNEREQLLGRAGRAAAVGGGRGQGRVRPGAEGRPAGQGGGVAVPDPVARAVRPGDDRGHGCGTPVLAWRNGSVPEVVADGETGFIVTSVEEMAAAVDRVGDLDPRVMRARVEEQFSADAMVAGYENVYQRCWLTTTATQGRSSALKTGVPESTVQPRDERCQPFL